MVAVDHMPDAMIVHVYGKYSNKTPPATTLPGHEPEVGQQEGCLLEFLRYDAHQNGVTECECDVYLLALC